MLDTLTIKKRSECSVPNRIVLLPTFAQVETYRKNAAQNGQVLFDVAVNTFAGWIADLWELHGDGRALVGTAQRYVGLHAALAQVPLDSASDPSDACMLADLPGVVKVAVACVHDASGVPAFEQAVQTAKAGGDCKRLHARELQLLKAIDLYKQRLDARGMVELGDACAYLAKHADTVFPGHVSVRYPLTVPPSWIEQAFYRAIPSIDVERSSKGEVRVEQAPASIDVRFAFPSGRYAQPAMIADLVRQAAESNELPVLVTTPDPIQLYRGLEEPLANEGLSCAVQARLSFADTDFGRMFLALRRFIRNPETGKPFLTDVLLSPFSGFSRSRAFEIDCAIRSDRTITCDHVLQQLRVESDTFSQLEELASDPDADILAGVFEQIAQNTPNRSVQWHAEQVAAIGLLRSCTAAARAVGASMKSVDAAVTYMAMPVSFMASVKGSPSPQVIVSSQPQASNLEPGTFGMCILADLSASSYPVADKDDAASTLLGKLGLAPVESALSRARRTFNALVKAPTSQLVFMRCLFDQDANESYPCAVLEEFIDSYRVDPSATDDVDKTYLLPAQLLAGAIGRGEEHLYANAVKGLLDARQNVSVIEPWPNAGSVGPNRESSVLLPRLLRDGSRLAKPCPSPSQLELYLECPYQWFASRRLGIETLDEQFDALGKGTFAHAVFERFYRTFQQTVAPKVLPENIEAARACMTQVLAAIEAEQPSADPGQRLVAVTALELRELKAFERQLLDYLDFEAQLLPTFTPTYFEFKIAPEDRLEYAGAYITGSVDRIDVDADGNAVIVDYKGSVTAEHAIGGKASLHPGKVQTRIYAQAIKRMLGLNVVGALYVTYGKTPIVSGAYDRLVLDAAHLPGIKADNCGLPVAQTSSSGEADGIEIQFSDCSFSDMLDRTEQVVEQAIARMNAADVEPHPAYAEACKYCPVQSCARREA